MRATPTPSQLPKGKELAPITPVKQRAPAQELMSAKGKVGGHLLTEHPGNDDEYSLDQDMMDNIKSHLVTE